MLRVETANVRSSAQSPLVMGAAGSVALHALVVAAAFLAAYSLGAFETRGGGEPLNAIEVMLDAPRLAPTPEPPRPMQPERPQFINAPVSSTPSDLAATPVAPTRPEPAPPPVQTATNPVGPASAPAAATVISPRERDAYISALMAWLNRFKQYPTEARRERVQGVVVVRFTIDAEGRVLTHSIARSSGHASLDQAAVDMFTRASPLPTPPRAFMRGAQTTLTLPIEFSLITR